MSINMLITIIFVKMSVITLLKMLM